MKIAGSPGKRFGIHLLATVSSCILALVLSAHAHGQVVSPSALWKPIRDDVYLQEIPQHIRTENPIHAVAVHDGHAYAGDAQGVARINDEKLDRVETSLRGVRELKSLRGHLWAIAQDGLWRMRDSQWEQVVPGTIRDLCEHNDSVYVASSEGLHRLTSAGVDIVTPTRGLQGIESYSGTVYVHDGRRVGLLQGDRIRYEEITDYGELARGCTIQDILAYGSRLYVATDEGLGMLRGMTWYMIQGEDGLPYEDTTSLARGFDRDLWIGTRRGAIRNTEDDFQFFGHERWLPHDQVNAVAATKRTVYIATDGGLGIITYEPYTLAKKAAYYERWLEEWGQKRLGFVHKLFWVNDEWQREVSDNDVGFSSHYLAAKCFEYAVTGDPDVRAEAVDMMKTVKWSEEITSIDGFPARSIYHVGERTVKAQHGSGGLPAEWHPTPDGTWEWKGDTSSDETDAHVYATSIFLMLVANEEERVWATEHLYRVVGHIVDNGFVLRDVDGNPTRWARWDPEYLQTPYGFYARGLNGLEAFNYTTTALHFTGDPKFEDARQQLIGWNYFSRYRAPKAHLSGGPRHALRRPSRLLLVLPAHPIRDERGVARVVAPQPRAQLGDQTHRRRTLVSLHLRGGDGKRLRDRLGRGASARMAAGSPPVLLYQLASRRLTHAGRLSRLRGRNPTPLASRHAPRKVGQRFYALGRTRRRSRGRRPPVDGSTLIGWAATTA